MKRQLAIERIYKLGDYKNIKIGDNIENLEDELAINRDVLDKLRLLQLLTIETTYRKYINMNMKLNDMDREEVVNYLTEQTTETFDDLIKLLNGNLEHKLEIEIEDEEIKND